MEYTFGFMVEKKVAGKKRREERNHCKMGGFFCVCFMP